MDAIVTYDDNYGISSGGEAPIKIATMRKKYAKMVKNNAVLMSTRYFEKHSAWDDPDVKTIVIDDSNPSFFQLNQHKKPLELKEVTSEDGPSYYEAHHINDLFAYEREYDDVVYVVGDGELFEKIVPYCEKLYVTKVHKAFENMDDFFPSYVEDCPRIFKVKEVTNRKQFKVDYDEIEYENTKVVRDPIGDIYETEPRRFVFVIGETNSGKDTIANWLIEKSGEFPEYDLRPVVSYTDRPIRNYEKDGVQHYFINKKEAEYMLEHGNHMIIAATKFTQPTTDGTVGETYNYFGLVNDISDGANLYIIDPIGAKDIIGRLRTLWPGSRILTVFINTPSFIRKIRAKARPDWDKDVYLARCASEKVQFAAYRETLRKHLTDGASIVFNNYGFGQEKRREKLFETIMDFLEGWENDGKLPDGNGTEEHTEQ